MKSTLLIGASHENSIGFQVGKRLSHDYEVRYFSRTNPDIQCDITEPDDVRKMLEYFRNTNFKGIVNTASIPYRFSLDQPTSDIEGLMKFIRIKLVGLLNIVYAGYQIFDQPFDLIQMGGSFEFSIPDLIHFAVVNRGLEAYVYHLQRYYGPKMRAFYLLLGSIKDSHMREVLFDQATLDQMAAGIKLKTFDDVYQTTQRILNGEITPGATVRL